MIRCIAIDDEPLALQQLARFISNIPDLELVASELSVDDAMPLLKKGNIDLLFLDIEMPDISGIDFARSLGDKAPCIIFTTAYPQYAVSGFRLDAVDYLLKPLSFAELQEAVEKVRRRIKPTALPEYTLCVRANGKTRIINTKDILYIKGLSEYVQIQLKDEKAMITTLESMKNLEEKLQHSNFMRIHRSYIVNLNHIVEANRTQVRISNNTIPVGDKYRNQLVKYIQSISNNNII